MKVKSKEQLYDLLTDDLAWRKKELTNLLNNVNGSKSKVLNTNLRSAVVLLYAHWEGFIKSAATNYISYIKYQNLRLDQVNTHIVALSLRNKLIEFEESNKTTKHVKFIDFLFNNLNEKVYISEDVIRTGSNLNSNILEEILTTIGIDFTPYSLKSNLIDAQLLNYRNTIAHGNYLPLDKNEYQIIHSEILFMIDQINTDISNAVTLGSFKKQVNQMA